MIEAVKADIVTIAAAKMRVKEERGQRVSPSLAVGEVFVEKGRERLKAVLEPVAPGSVALGIGDYLQLLDRNGIYEFTDSWAQVFVGAALPMVDRVPADGWHSQAFFDRFNDATRGTPVPAMEMSDVYNGLSANAARMCTDEFQTNLIIDALIQRSKLQRLEAAKPADDQKKSLIDTPPLAVFFGSVSDFTRLTPLRSVVAEHTDLFLGPVIQNGRDFVECMARLSAPARR